MGRLIDDLLTFARVSRQPVRKQPVQPKQLIRQCLTDSTHEQEGRQLDIRIGELPVCWGDEALLKQVWMNLVANAVKYSRARNPAIIEIGCGPAAIGPGPELAVGMGY